jgi:hypothetical protein
MEVFLSGGDLGRQQYHVGGHNYYQPESPSTSLPEHPTATVVVPTTDVPYQATTSSTSTSTSTTEVPSIPTEVPTTEVFTTSTAKATTTTVGVELIPPVSLVRETTTTTTAVPYHELAETGVNVGGASFLGTVVIIGGAVLTLGSKARQVYSKNR